jgi:hypothetical protein
VDELDFSHRKSKVFILDQSINSMATARTEETDDRSISTSSHKVSDLAAEIEIPLIVSEEEEVVQEQEILTELQEEREEEQVKEESEEVKKKSEVEESSLSKTVRFSEVKVHEHPICLGDNPGSHCGVPLSIAWECCKTTTTTVDEFENRSRRQIHQLRMEPVDRGLVLKHMGYSRQEIKEGTAAVNKVRVERKRTKERLRFAAIHDYQEQMKRAILNSTIRRSEKQQERKFLEQYRNQSLYLYLKKGSVNTILHDQLSDSIVSESS